MRLRTLYEERDGDPDIKPNVYTANAVMNACAFSKHDEDREDMQAHALESTPQAPPADPPADAPADPDEEPSAESDEEPPAESEEKPA